MISVVNKTTSDYNRQRLGRAIKESLTANLTPVGVAENFAHHVVEKVEAWLQDKTEITAHELRLQAVEALANYDPETAGFYLTEKKLF
jgi:transcriptional regulator NrdR family protein